MRKILVKILTVGGLALLVLPSCKNNDPVVTSSGSKIGTLQASTTSLVLDRTRTNDPSAAVTFNFTATQYNFKAALIATNLQVDSVGDNWKNPQVITLSKGATTQTYSTIDFDNLVLKLVPADVSSKVNVRIQYQLSAYVSDYSNVITMDVTPFKATAWLYITGNFSGWANPGAAEDSLISVTGNGIYTGIIDFQNPNNGVSGDDEFLILPAKNWNHKYATNDPKGTVSKTLAYDAPNNFYAPGEGYYLVTANINKGTISFQAVDYYSLIGNDFAGQNWDTDNFMKFINDGSNNWEITKAMVATSGGGFKVRQDSQWTNSWGFLPVNPDGKTLSDISGPAGVGAQNMTISAAGTYTMTFTMAPSAYGTNPYNSATPTLVPYTLVKQ